MDIGQKIQKIRLNQNLTQKQLSKMSGVNYSTLTKLEAGFIKKPSLEVVSLLAKALEITIEELQNE